MRKDKQTVFLNLLDNLELCTRSGQIVHAHKLRLINQYGERNPAAKLTESIVEEIRSRYKVGELQKNLALEFGVCKGTISSVVKNKVWRKQDASFRL